MRHSLNRALRKGAFLAVFLKFPKPLLVWFSASCVLLSISVLIACGGETKRSNNSTNGGPNSNGNAESPDASSVHSTRAVKGQNVVLKPGADLKFEQAASMCVGCHNPQNFAITWKDAGSLDSWKDRAAQISVWVGAEMMPPAELRPNTRLALKTFVSTLFTSRDAAPVVRWDPSLPMEFNEAQNYCVSCHGGKSANSNAGGWNSARELDGWRQYRNTILESVLDGRMPPSSMPDIQKERLLGFIENL
jgi:cytochrome c553